MTMHLHHPSLTLSGKRKGKQKWASAEQKRKAMELKSEWDSKVKEWSSMSTVKTAQKGTTSIPKYSPPIGRERKEPITRIDTGVKGAVNVKETRHYTGDRLLGITIVHKSCLQPVFSQEQAVEAAHMRR